ncbi:MAG: 4Fe-4S binding protein [Xenococcus sp. (in: cyanobacteria)]
MWIGLFDKFLSLASHLAQYLTKNPKLFLDDSLPHTAYLSASLLLVITAGAVIGSVIYERRLWCRYLCPIGGMNGMFAKLSMIELRATEQICGTQCDVFACRQGSNITPVKFAEALPNEGQATEGCPLNVVPCNLSDNRDCVGCMGCVKGCPNRSVQLNLRLPASDLWEDHKPFWAEVALLLLLFGGVFMHYSHSFLSWFGFEDIALDSEHLLTAVPVITLLLSIPFLITYLIHQLVRQFDGEMPGYLTVIYAYLPMILGLNLAYYIPAAITEAGNILPVVGRTFGYSGAGLPWLTWSVDVADFLQGFTLLSAIAFSIHPLLKISQRPFLSNLPHLLMIVGFAAVFFQLMV